MEMTALFNDVHILHGVGFMFELTNKTYLSSLCMFTIRNYR